MFELSGGKLWRSIRARGFKFSSSYREFELSRVRVSGGSSYRGFELSGVRVIGIILYNVLTLRCFVMAHICWVSTLAWYKSVTVVARGSILNVAIVWYHQQQEKWQIKQTVFLFLSPLMLLFSKSLHVQWNENIFWSHCMFNEMKTL